MAAALQAPAQAPTQALDLLVLTFNCAKNLINVPVFATHLRTALAGDGLPDIVAFSLQEAAPMAYGFIGFSLLAPYFARFDEALNTAASRILGAESSSSAVPGSLGRRTSGGAGTSGKPYTLVHSGNVGYTALLLFARDPRMVKNLQVAEVGFGTADMGNKGAVGARFTYVDVGGEGDGGKETELTFVATHLMHNEWNVPTRNANWATIVRGLTFENPAEVLKPKKPKVRGDGANGHPARNGDSSAEAGGDEEEERELLTPSSGGTPDPHSEIMQRKLHELSIYRPTSNLFVAGDLNYRISSSSPPPLATFPSLTADPSEAAHYSNFFALDQLTRERAAGRTLHGLTEGEVKFPPTYKYTVLPQQGPLWYTEDDDGQQGGDEDDGEGESESIPLQLSREEREIREVVPHVFAPHRWPSWTDRVLFLQTPVWVQRRYAEPAPRIDVVRYDALPVVRSSDHRPVFLRARVPLLAPGEMAPPEDIGDANVNNGSGVVSAEEARRDPRVRLPVEIDPEAWDRRAVARRREMMAGWTMWVSTTREGLAVVLVTVMLGIAAWWFSRGA